MNSVCKDMQLHTLLVVARYQKCGCDAHETRIHLREERECNKREGGRAWSFIPLRYND